MTTTDAEPAILAWRCQCDHWGGFGDSGTTIIRYRCPSARETVRTTDSLKVCGYCAVNCAAEEVSR
jgi:hypothetical protein